MDKSLEIINLTKAYPDFRLDNINFSLKQGEIMGLIGENGAGKTTIIKLIVNAIKRDSGTIKIFGKDNIKFEKEIKNFLRATLSQNPYHACLNAQNINKIMKHIYQDWKEERYFYYIEKFQVPLTKRIKNYSSGMKVKLIMASVLATSPKLIILDEPTSGLDPIVRNMVLDVYRQYINEVNGALLFSSHILSDVEKIADSVTFLHKGKILFSMEKSELMMKFSNTGKVKNIEDIMLMLTEREGKAEV